MKALAELTMMDGVKLRSPQPAVMIATTLAQAPTAWVQVELLNGQGRAVPTFIRPPAVIAVGDLAAKS